MRHVSQLLALVAAMLAAAHAPGSRADAAGETPTVVHVYAVPATLTQQERTGSCAPRSIAGAFRGDALRCVTGGAIYDPCFTTARAGVALCDADPRQLSRGLLVKASPEQTGAIDAPSILSRAWFLELADGAVCRTATGAPRAFDGEAEIYTCAGSPADADSVMLGDVDDSAPVWTIKRAMLNKKFTPQTIKSLTVVAVKAVWR